MRQLLSLSAQRPLAVWLIAFGIVLLVSLRFFPAEKPVPRSSSPDLSPEVKVEEVNLEQSTQQQETLKPNETTYPAVKWVFSLTTSPKRLPLLDETLDTLVNQSIPADKVLIHIPPTFRGAPFESEKEVLRLQAKYGDKVTVHLAKEDYGPGTKLLGALNVIPATEDVWLVTVDDDFRYLPDTLKGFAHRLSEVAPSAKREAMGYAGLVYPKLFQLPFVHGTKVSILEGFAAVAYHRHMFAPSSAFFQYFDEVTEDASCKLADDLIFSNWLALQSIRRVLVKYEWVNRWQLVDSRIRNNVSEDENALHKDQGNFKRYAECELFLKRKQGDEGKLWWGFDP